MLSDDLAAFVRALRKSDPHAAITGIGALAVHAGRPLSEPLAVRVSRSRRVPRALDGRLRLLRRTTVPEVALVQRVPVVAPLPAVIEVLDASTGPLPLELVVSVLGALGARERASLARAAARPGARPGHARAAHLLGLLRGVPIVAKPDAVVALQPGGFRGGAVDPSTRVRANAPSGVASAEDPDPSLLSADERSLFVLARLGARLDTTRAAHVVGAGAERALRRLVAAGWLTHDDVGLLRPVAPHRAHAGFGSHPDATEWDALIAWLERGGADERLDALRLRMARGEHGALRELVRLAPQVAARPSGPRELEAWATTLATSHPEIADALRVSVLEHDGRLHDALALAREVAARTDARSRHAAALEVARLAWRAGRTSEADAVLRQIEGARRGRHRREIDDARLLRASMALERGDTGEARRLLRAARERAETDGDDEMLAQVLRREGALEARAGLPRPASGAYRAALVALRRVPIPRDPELEGILLSNLATTEGWQGRLDVAVELFERALARRGARPLASLNVRAARALLRGDSFRELFREAERLGDARLRAELGVYHAEECLFRGELARADQSLIAVRVALAELGGHERILEALAAHAEACVRARRGRSAAREELLAAVEALADHGARFHAARAARVAASVLAEIRATEAAVQAIARSAELADPVGIVLSTDATRHVVALAEAAASSHPRAHDHARAALESIGRIRAEAALRAAARSDLIPSLPRTSSESEALTWCIGPEGVHTMSRVDRDALRRRTDSVVLDRELGVLFVHGTPSRSLGRMRHVEPLLAHLAARRPDMVSLDELARVVWLQRLGPSLRTAITTAVARARSLLGPARDVLITRGVADRRTYGLRADARFFRLDAGGSGPALGPEP